MFFFDGCAKPRLERNQLLGYLGVFSGGFYQLSSEVDICIIPFETYQLLKVDKSDKIIKEINEKMNTFNEETNRYINTISSVTMLSEHQLFKYIKDHLLSDDQVRIDQFEKINFNYEI